MGVGTALALAAGPLLGAVLILVTDAPLALLNVVAGIVYALAMPFVALVTCYVDFDTRTRLELQPEPEPDELPAELEHGSEPAQVGTFRMSSDVHGAWHPLTLCRDGHLHSPAML